MSSSTNTCFCQQPDFPSDERDKNSTASARKSAFKKLATSRNSEVDSSIIDEITAMQEDSTHRILGELALTTLMSTGRPQFSMNRHQASMLSQGYDDMATGHPKLKWLCNGAKEVLSSSISENAYKPNVPTYPYPSKFIYPDKTQVSKEEYEATELVRTLAYLFQHRQWPSRKEIRYALLSDVEK